jgi:hypothetical protein
MSLKVDEALLLPFRDKKKALNHVMPWFEPGKGTK